MTNEEKQLLLKDLCARLPYGVRVGMGVEIDANNPYTLLGINPSACGCAEIYVMRGGVTCDGRLDVIKPYLRPVSNMTEEEISEIKRICDEDDLLNENGELVSTIYGMTVLHGEVEDVYPYNLKIKISQNLNYAVLDFLHAHHFDYRGLIEKGLAIEVTESNNPYKD